MAKRQMNPIYVHEGFTYRFSKKYADGSEMLICTERSIGCKALCRRDTVTGEISVRRDHVNHEANDDLAQSKLVNDYVKELALTTTMLPREIRNSAIVIYGVTPVDIAGSSKTLARKVNRWRRNGSVERRNADYSDPVDAEELAEDYDDRELSLMPFSMEGVVVKTEVDSSDEQQSDHSDASPIPEVDKAEYPAIWKFMIEQTRDRNGKCLKHYMSPFGKELWFRYQQKSGSLTSVASFQTKFAGGLSRKIQTADLDEAAKVKLHYSYDIPVDPAFLDDLRTRAVVELTRSGCIKKYRDKEVNGLSLPITETIPVLVRDRPPPERCVPEQFVSNFHAPELSGPERSTPPASDSTALKHSATERLIMEHSASTLSATRPELGSSALDHSAVERPEPDSSAPEPSTSDRPAPEHSTSESTYQGNEPAASEEAEMTLGDSDYEESQSTCPDSGARRVKYTDDDETSMWKFLLKKIKETGKIERNSVKPKGKTLWREYKQTHETDRAEDSLSCRYRKVMSSKLHLTNLDVDSKVNLYYALGIPVNETFLEQLRETADVRVDREGCILRYMKRCKGEIISPTERKPIGMDLMKSKMERKRSLATTDETAAQPAKRKAPAPEESSEDRSVINEFGPLLGVSPSGTSARFTPLKRVQIEENDSATQAVSSILANQSRVGTEETAQSAIQTEEQPAESVQTPEEQDGRSSTSSSSTLPEVPVLSVPAQQPAELSGPSNLKPFLDSVEQVIVQQNLELVNEFKKLIESKEVRERELLDVTPPEDEKTSAKDFLYMLNNMIVSLKSPSLDGCLEKVKVLAEKADDKSIPMDRIRVIMEATLAMIPL